MFRHHSHVSACITLKFNIQPHSDAMKVSACFLNHAVWNLRDVIWFHSTILSCSSAKSCYSVFFLPGGPFSRLKLVFFFLNLQCFPLGDRLFCMAPVLQLGEVSSLVVCTAWCQYHMALVLALVFTVGHLYNIFSLLLLLSIPVLHFFFWGRWVGLGLVNQRNGPRYQFVLALCAFLTRAILKGLILQKCVYDVCVCTFCFI